MVKMVIQWKNMQKVLMRWEMGKEEDGADAIAGKDVRGQQVQCSPFCFTEEGNTSRCDSVENDLGSRIPGFMCTWTLSCSRSSGASPAGVPGVCGSALPVALLSWAWVFLCVIWVTRSCIKWTGFLISANTDLAGYFPLHGLQARSRFLCSFVWRCPHEVTPACLPWLCTMFQFCSLGWGNLLQWKKPGGLASISNSDSNSP